MAVSAEQLARELRAFDDRRRIVQALRRALTREVKPTVQAARAHARDILPAANGLGAWVAAARIGVRVGYSGRSAGVRVKGARKSLDDASDLAGIDAGKVRSPTYGHRPWHTQTVPAGWWSTPFAQADGFRAAADAEIDRVLDEIRG